MAQVDVNLNEVVTRPPLPNKEWTLAFVKLNLEQAKNPNKTTGQREWLIKAELQALEPEAKDYQGGGKVFHIWSLSPGALEAADTHISPKIFMEKMNIPWGADGKFDTNDWLPVKFVASTELEEYNGRFNPKIRKIIGPVT